MKKYLQKGLLLLFVALLFAAVPVPFTSQAAPVEQADGTVRISLGLFNTMEEMDCAAAQMMKAAALLAKYRRR